MFYCEFLIYYVVLFQVCILYFDPYYNETILLIRFQCSWPELNGATEDKKIPIGGVEEPVKAMFIADTHLLGTRRGHWFDKLRRY